MADSKDEFEEFLVRSHLPAGDRVSPSRSREGSLRDRHRKGHATGQNGIGEAVEGMVAHRPHQPLRHRYSSPSDRDMPLRMRTGSPGTPPATVTVTSPGQHTHTERDFYYCQQPEPNRSEPDGMERPPPPGFLAHLTPGTSPSHQPRRHSNYAELSSGDAEAQPPEDAKGLQNRVLCHMACHVLEDEDWAVGSMRPRISSMPSRPVRRSSHHFPILATLKSAQDVHKVRSFTITPKGVINQGDHYVSSSTSVASTESDATINSNASGDGSPASAHGSQQAHTSSFLRIMVFGEPGVGKRALIQTFLTPDPTVSFGKFNLVM